MKRINYLLIKHLKKLKVNFNSLTLTILFTIFIIGLLFSSHSAFSKLKISKSKKDHVMHDINIKDYHIIGQSKEEKNDTEKIVTHQTPEQMFIQQIISSNNDYQLNRTDKTKAEAGKVDWNDKFPIPKTRINTAFIRSKDDKPRWERLKKVFPEIDIFDEEIYTQLQVDKGTLYEDAPENLSDTEEPDEELLDEEEPDEELLDEEEPEENVFDEHLTDEEMSGEEQLDNEFADDENLDQDNPDEEVFDDELIDEEEDSFDENDSDMDISDDETFEESSLLRFPSKRFYTASASPKIFTVSVSQLKPKLGNTLAVFIKTKIPTKVLLASFGGEKIPFFKMNQYLYRGLIGLDVQQKVKKKS